MRRVSSCEEAVARGRTRKVMQILCQSTTDYLSVLGTLAYLPLDLTVDIVSTTRLRDVPAGPSVDG
jgi:hypothetical protein